MDACSTNATPEKNNACLRVGPLRVIRTMPVPAYVHAFSARKSITFFIVYEYY